MLEDDVVILGKEQQSQGHQVQAVGTSIQCREKITMTFGTSVDSCLIFWAESPSSEHCKNFLEAVTMASNAHQLVGKVRAPESVSGDTMTTLAKVWNEWCGVAENGMSGVGSKKNCGEKSPVLQGGICQNDRHAQRAAYDVSRLTGWGGRGFRVTSY